MKPLKILGTGIYLPKKAVTDVDLELELNLEQGWVKRTGGVKTRYFSNRETETTSMMGAEAAKMALANANMNLSEIDLILSASGSQEQVIPSTACFIQRALGLEDSGVASFDVNATCLSFVVALDLASYYLEAGTYKNILIVSSEIASVGLNKNHKESYTILGDGAAAVVVSKTPHHELSGIWGMKFNTYSSKANICQIQGGGTKLHPAVCLEPDNRELFMFEMDGREAFRFISHIAEDFFNSLLNPLKLSFSDIDYVIPHQASRLAMDYVLKKRLKIGEHQLIDTLEKYGNTIAASIPMALHEGICDGRIKRGHKLMLGGTSAGMSIGGMVLTY
jgi:3-oxoacyl-[acyl-carrier-protein] synthase-3